MHILIAQSDARLGRIWQRHLERTGKMVKLVTSEEAAVAELSKRTFSLLILDIVLAQGSALAVADYAGYRRPGMRVVFVTRRNFFSDGSIFSLSSNACAMIQPDTNPTDLTAMVEHFAARPNHTADMASVA